MTETQIPSLFMVELWVQDLSRSLAWYHEILGLEVELLDDARGFALLASGNARLALKVCPSVQVSGVRLAFEVIDLPAEFGRLRSLGVEISEIEDDLEGFRSSKLIDPDGTLITLFAWNPPRV